MIRDIIKDEAFLRKPSKAATPADLPVAQDLCDTLAANMIGVSKRIIVADDEGKTLVLLNPEILKTRAPFRTEEACLSLEGTRPTKRYGSIQVRYQNSAFQVRIKTFSGWTAQIIQHEIDHCNGIII